MTTPEHTIEALCERSRDISLEKGWLSPDGTDPRPFYTVVALFHTELSEAFEDIRSNKKVDEVWYEVNGIRVSAVERARSVEPRASDIGAFKPCGIPIEFADFIIRVAQYFGSAKQSKRFEEVVLNVPNLTIADRLIPENGEQLIAQLHADVSMASIASLGRHPAADPMHHLALAVHWTFAFCEKNNIDLWSAIDEKEAYNRTRPVRHGGKAC